MSFYNTIFKLRFWDKVQKKGPIPEHCPELDECHAEDRVRKGRNVNPMQGRKHSAATRRAMSEAHKARLAEGLHA